jgi:hypothetical protein
MFPNPYAAQMMAEHKMADARRQADKARLLASLPKRNRQIGSRLAVLGGAILSIALIAVAL